MKKAISFGLMVVLCLVLAACQSNKSVQEESVLESYFENLKTGEFEAAAQKLESVPDKFNYSDNEVMKHFFAKMTYTVKETKETAEGQEATVVISLPNTGIIYDSMMSDIGDDVQKLQGGDDASKSKASDMMINFMLSKIDAPDVVMVENTVKVILKKVDGKLVIVPNDSLSKALSGLPDKKK